MPTKRQELVVEITAQANQAQRSIDQLVKSAKPLEEGIEAPVKLTGADKAADQLEDAAKAAKDLDQATQAVDAGGVKNIGGPAAAAAADFDKIAENAEQAAKAVADVGKDGGGGLRNVRAASDEVTDAQKTMARSADGSKNALANLVGNTSQDLSGLLGPLGSVGVAIGQVAEYTADAANESGNFGAALKGAAGVALPIAGLSVALLAVNNLMQDYQKRQAEIKAAHEAGSAAFVEATGDVKRWGEALDEAFSAGTSSNVEAFNKVIKDALGKDTTSEVLQNLSTIGKGADDLGETMQAVDEDFRSFAVGILTSAGATEEQAGKMAGLIQSVREGKTAIHLMGEEGIDVDKMGLTDVTLALADLNGEARKQDFEKYADSALKAAAAVGDNAGKVKEARDATASATEAWKLYKAQQIEAEAASRENAQAAEEGAAAVAASGSILDQVNRQLTESEENLAEATKDVTEAQDKWLGTTVTLPAAQDDLTESVITLTEGLKKQAEAADEGAGSFEGDTKAALDNRDAQRSVYEQAFQVIDIMGKQGATTDQLAAATQNMANRAYNLAIQNGASEEAAARLRDTILTVPTSRSTEMTYAEKNYGTMLDHRDTLAEDITTDVWFQGHVDRSVLNAINEIRQAGGIPGPGMVAPSAAAVPAVAAPVAAAPVAAAAGTRSATVTVPVRPVVNVNVSAGVVADTFQLQRVVERAVRSGARLGGRRP